MNTCNKNNYVFLASDLNARVGNIPITNIVGNFGGIFLSESRKRLRDCASYNGLKITNTFFRKNGTHRYTWRFKITY